ncbi:HdeD family acid-resistance protein [Pseudooceanicola sp. HF7]|uniref:HdeD family acid-resistance protein n=1 Tax=Pseudooceanicola sp. HF7 TaxID=2721560 RepID=UPI0014309324|nr:DUF308 domain-containing protein [Pseudooceanicola sp. HF7]NIZ11626.1 hypothetical protein [Pseudooceanicola sp. HF7]
MKVSSALIFIALMLLIGGVLALMNPFAASLAVTTLVGIFFLASGVIQAWILFRAQAHDHRLWNGFVALLTIVAGVWLLANPLQGTVSLTLILGVVFFVMGVVRLLMATQLGGTPFLWLAILSGVASVGIGLLVFFDFASATSALLGLLLGFQLLAEGIGLMTFGVVARRKGY